MEAIPLLDMTSIAVKLIFVDSYTVIFDFAPINFMALIYILGGKKVWKVRFPHVQRWI